MRRGVFAYRVVSGASIAEQSARYKPGKTAHWPYFATSTGSLALAHRAIAAAGNQTVVFKVRSKRARDLSEFSVHPSETMFVFAPNRYPRSIQTSRERADHHAQFFQGCIPARRYPLQLAMGKSTGWCSKFVPFPFNSYSAQPDTDMEAIPTVPLDHKEAGKQDNVIIFLEEKESS